MSEEYAVVIKNSVIIKFEKPILVVAVLITVFSLLEEKLFHHWNWCLAVMAQFVKYQLRVSFVPKLEHT